jgi:serine/threonine protein kinase
MPELPRLTAEQVAKLVPTATDVVFVSQGGQKLVFRGLIEGRTYAFKFALLPAGVTDDDPITEVEARAAREVETMRDCDSAHMVKLGPIGLTIREFEGQRLLLFSEEFIDGQDLKSLLEREGPLAASEIVRLGQHMAHAIQGLWNLGKIHRDIKPQNIMRRSSNGDYVLLDAGYAFDVVGESLSKGFFVGTVPYFPPERFDYSSRRSVMDFRSDLFSLGVTMYQLATRVHPFWTAGETSQQVFARICGQRPAPPSSVNPAVPAQLDAIILRLLGKAPHLRFRKIEQFVSALQGVEAH